VSAKDTEIARVAAQLDALLGELRDNVDALSAILTRPDPPGGEDDERLVAP
jgi:hypothetical protein